MAKTQKRTVPALPIGSTVWLPNCVTPAKVLARVRPGFYRVEFKGHVFEEIPRRQLFTREGR